MAARKVKAIDLLLGLAGVPKQASEVYAAALVAAGTDTKTKFQKLEEEDMQNIGMKKGHIRCVIGTLSQTTKRKGPAGGAAAGASKRAKGAAAGKNYLSGAVFCMSGTMSTSRAKLQAEIKAGGGAVASSMTKKVTHLLTTVAEVLGETSKVVSAEAMGVPLCEEGFISACEQAGKLVDHADFVINSSKAGGSGDSDGEASEGGGDTPTAHPRSAQQCPSAEVLQTSLTIWDADLNQQERDQNVDKFYILQVQC
jgi:hypothetical protein